ncbi:MAG: hypothetical protein ACQKBV_11630 [Puniceicoccales bacterium]
MISKLTTCLLLTIAAIVAHAAPEVEINESVFVYDSNDERAAFFYPTESDTDKWTEKLTFVYYPDQKGPEAVKAIYEEIMGKYQQYGRLLKAFTVRNEAQEIDGYLLVAIIQIGDVTEALMTRVTENEEGNPITIVYQHRFYSRAQAMKVVEWFQENGERMEVELLGVSPIPARSEVILEVTETTAE